MHSGTRGDVAPLPPGDRAPNQQLESLRRQLGLDQPIYVQYLRFAVGALEGDFGMSLRSNHAAFDDVWAAFPVTIQLSLAALGLAVAAGVPLGVVAALRPLSRFDNIVMTVTLFGVSMPIFWYGLMMILVFGAFLDWLPIGGLMPIGVEPPRGTGMSVVDAVISRDWHLVVVSLRHLVLPAFTLGTIPIAIITLYTRSESLSMRSHSQLRT